VRTSCKRIGLLLLGMLTPPALVAAQVSGPTYTFTAGTVISPTQVNSNFSVIYGAALNRQGGTMAGALVFSPDNTYDLGASGTTRPRDLFLGRNATIGGTLGVTGASTLSSTLAVTGAVTLSSTLAVTGTTTLTGATALTGTLTVTSTTNPQATFRYDGSNYVNIGIGSAGGVTFDAVGASAGFTLSDSVAVTGTITPSGQILAADGSSGTPGISFSSDTNLGLYRVSADILGIVAANGLYLPDSVRFASATTSGLTYSGGVMTLSENGVTVASVDSSTGFLLTEKITLATQSFAGLGSPANGTLYYCTDCTIANPCAGSSTGAIAKRINGGWVCN
jgi:hypothetical protein